MPDNPDDQQQQTPVAPDPAQQPADQGQQPQSNLTQALTSSVQPTPQNPPQQPVQTTTDNDVPTSVDAQAQQAAQNRDRALNFHPAVTAAHVARKVGEAIAGGPQYQKVIDPETGEVTRKPIPPSTKSILTGALANILGGIGQVGQGYVAMKQGRAPAPPRPLPTQVEQQQRDQQADEDFDRVQQTKVRQAKVLEANLNAIKSGYAIGKQDDDTKKSVVQNHASDLQQWQKSGAVEADKVPSDQLMKRGYDPSKYIAIPDGTMPVMGADGQQSKDKNGVPLTQLTYSVVDGTTQTPLTQDKYDQFAKYGLMQAKDGFKLPEGATITGASLSMMNHKLDLINQTQREIDEVNPGKVDLASEIKKNPAVLKAIGDFHNDAVSDNAAAQLDSIKTNHPQSANIMKGLFGGDAGLQAYQAKQQAPPDKMDVNSARQIISDPRTDKTSDNGPGKPVGSPAYQAAVNFMASAKQDKDETANDAEARREQNEEKKQQLKDAGTMGYVEDQNGVLNYVSKADATKPGSQYSSQSFQEVKPSDLAKDRAVVRPLSDVQMNISHYRGAANDYDAAVKRGGIDAAHVTSDRNNLTTIFSAPAVTDAAAAHAGAGGFGVSVPTLAADLNAGLAQKVTNAYNSLTPEGKTMADNYARAQAAIPAWVKAITNSGRGSKEQLDIELKNLLPPYYNISDIHNRLDGFQDNLNNQKATLPQNLVGKQIPDPIQRTDKAQPKPNTQPNPQQKPAPAPEGTIVNTANGQMIKQGGQWVAHKGGQ